MDGPPPTPDRLSELLEERSHGAVATALERLAESDAGVRKRSLRAVRDVAAERPGVAGNLAAPLSEFLADDDRAVRLTTAKLFVTLAQSKPAAVRPVVDALAERLADDREFYYVRARCAEALGYVAADAPEAVAAPGTLADLRVGLEFDEPEVREKLAKALAYVALGDPDRLRHLVGSLARHLDDDSERVRYYLCTALVVVGCAHPERLAGAASPLRSRLSDGNPYVRGRAAEALGLAAGPDAEVDASPDQRAVDGDGDEPPFLSERLRFLRNQLSGQPDDVPMEIGTVESVRNGVEDAVEEMTSSNGCPTCGLDLPDGGPPACPRCGTPR